MKNFFADYLTYSNRDKRGILVLMTLLMFFISAPYFIEYFETDSSADFSQFEKDIRLFEEGHYSYHPNDKKDDEHSSKSEDKIVANLFAFNPNNLSNEKWKELGLREGQIKMIKKFESKGGVFRKKEDLQKMYCLQPFEYKRLEPFIVIPGFSKDTTFHPSKKSQVTDNLIIELNASDSAAFTLLKGIGPGFASRIVKYRKRLGGYYKKEQLREVYGLDSVLYSRISDHLFLGDSGIRKININLAGVDELRKHPYISFHIATILVNYRKAHGQYKDVSEIKKTLLVNEELYLKLVNYITID